MSTNFDFRALLSPYDFEILVRDLLTIDLGINLKAFAEGPDSGIDLRYSTNANNTIIVQCKRSEQLTKKQLLKEAEKIEKLDINKYYIATSKELTVAKCNQILNIFHKWMKDENQIYSKSRLNQLITKNPQVMREHYKLWINSSEVFDQFINNDLLGRSRFLKEDIARSLKYYVKHDGYNKAVDILNNNNLIIISGIPGIGKTTMARILVWAYLQQDYEIIEIRNINEGERILKEDEKRKQVLYFDDFLGENFLQYDVIEGRANDLNTFLRRFLSQRGTSKKLIMTTREYILNQAKAKYAKLNNNEIDITKYILDLEKYSDFNKALILYNHLYYSNIPMEYIESILQDNLYRKIINHRNFSPRIIEAMTINLHNISPENYADEFIANLDNPSRIWEGTFESEISECSRYLLYLLASFGSNIILMTSLESAFDALTDKSISGLNIETHQNSFRDSIKELQDTFIKINSTRNNDFIIEFMNPSIKDFLNSKLLINKKVLQSLISSSLFFNQILFIYRNFIKDYHQELIKITEKRIIEYWDKFQLSRLNQVYYYKNKWNVTNINLFEKLGLTVRNFNISDNIELRMIVIKDFNKLDLSSYTRVNDYDDYLDILSRIIEYFECNSNEIMNLYISNMKFTRQIVWFEQFRDIFKGEYENFIIDNKEEIQQIVEEIIDSEIRSEDDLSELEELEDDIQNIESIFGFYLFPQSGDLNEKIETLRAEPEIDEELSHEDIDKVRYSSAAIIGLFKEEMFKKKF